MGGGFSLVELITIIAIIGIMAGVAVPTLSSLGSSRGGVAARQALRDLTFARQRAIATGTVSWVVFNASTETWSVLAENPSAPGRSGAAIITDLATGRPFTQTLGSDWAAGIGITSATFNAGAEVGFDWLGRPLNSTEAALSATGTVIFTTGQQVTVQPGTGYAAFVP